MWFFQLNSSWFLYTRCSYTGSDNFDRVEILCLTVCLWQFLDTTIAISASWKIEKQLIYQRRTATLKSSHLEDVNVSWLCQETTQHEVAVLLTALLIGDAQWFVGYSWGQVYVMCFVISNLSVGEYVVKIHLWHCIAMNWNYACWRPM